MPGWLLPAIAGVGSLIGGALSNRGQRTSQTGTQTSMPALDPAFSGLQGSILNMVQNRLSSGSALPSGYGAGQISNINRTYNLAGQNLSNTLVARGLSGSPVAANAAANLQQARAGSIVDMERGLPLLEREMQNQDLASALQALQLGRGQTSTMSSASTGAGNALGGGATSLMNMLSYLYGAGKFGAAGNGMPGTYVGPA